MGTWTLRVDHKPQNSQVRSVCFEAGVSRSASVVIAYLMVAKGADLKLFVKLNRHATICGSIIR